MDEGVRTTMESSNGMSNPSGQEEGKTALSHAQMTRTDFSISCDDPECWQTIVHPPSWTTIGGRVRPASQSGIALTFEPRGKNTPPLTDEEVGRAQWFMDQEREVMLAVMRGLLSAYPDLIKRYGYDDDEQSRHMPKATSVAEISGLVRAVEVCIHAVVRDGLPYLGVFLDCTWDAEHGAGVLLHGTRVLAAGDADYAMDPEMAAKDALVDVKSFQGD